MGCLPLLGGNAVLAPSILLPDERVVETALQRLEKQITKNPQDASGYLLRGWAELRRDKPDYDKAASEFNKVVDLNPRMAWAYNSRAEVSSRKHAYDAAISDLNEAITLTRLRLRPTRCIRFSPRVAVFLANLAALREINPACRWRCV